MYGNNVMSIKIVWKWYQMIVEEPTSIFDDFRTDRPPVISSHGNKDCVEAMIEEDRRIKVRGVAKELDMSIGTAHHMIHHVLENRIVSKVGTASTDS